MAVRSKKIKQVTADTGMPDGNHFCRRCRRILKDYMFHKAVDHVLDTNGLFSVCKPCTAEVFASLMAKHNDDIKKATLDMCVMLNVRYDETAIEAALKQVEKRSDNFGDAYWGFYRAKLIVAFKSNGKDNSETMDLTFQPDVKINFDAPILTSQNIDDEVIKFWGKGYSPEQYEWLEETYSDWTKTHKSDTQAEIVLLREIVFLQFEIETARQNNDDVTSMVEDLQKLMKTASLDPSKANTQGVGKGQETFGQFIKMIEADEPAEIFGDERNAFRDFGNIDSYFRKYITRPLKNFILQARDFNVTGDDDNAYEEYIIDNNEAVSEIDDEFVEPIDTGGSSDEN